MISYKIANKLFKGLYQYKVVLIVPGASMFRSGDMDSTYRQLKEINFDKPAPGSLTYYRANIKTQEDLDYCFKLQSVLKKLTSVEIRVESPWISVYTSNKSDVDALVKIDSSRIKYVCTPPANGNLASGEIILPKIDFDFKVTLGKTICENSAFVDWAETNSKVLLTKRCKSDLAKDRSWGGSYFYITGEKNLLLAKMHLGGSINKVERILKS